MSNLTDMQKRYIWLAGSYTHAVVQQGHGVRGVPLYYAFSDDLRTLVLFGYSNPLYWLENRGLFKKLQDGRSYDLTEAGQKEYARLVAAGFGQRQGDSMKEAKLKAVV